jgi:hypothetical protein
MRDGNVLFSAAHFFVVFFFLSLGAFFFALPHANYFRTLLINILQGGKDPFYILGGAFLGVGILLFIAAYLINKGQYIKLKGKKPAIDIEKRVIKKYTERYFQEKFSTRSTVSDVAIRGKSTIEILTSFPKGEEEETLDEIEEELGILLSNKLGYHQPFTLTIAQT